MISASKLFDRTGCWAAGLLRRGPPAAEEPRARLALEAFAATDRGRVRCGNEDTILLSAARHDADSPSTSVYREGLLAVLADGMGGSNAGEVASSMACDIVAKRLLGLHGVSFPGRHPCSLLVDALESANREIFARSVRDKDCSGMGTTCVALAVHGDEAWMAYVGDSRLYLAREGHIYRMTEDHSVVFELVRRGVLTVEEAHNHPDRNVLSRALGTRESVTVSAWKQPFLLQPGDRFLLCSDGLHDLVDDTSMLDAMLEGQPRACVPQLIAAANARGGYDNISAIVVEVLDPEAPPAAEPEGGAGTSSVPITREFAQV